MCLRGDLEHKNVWLVNLQTGEERQWTYFPDDFNIRDFDISPDRHDLVFERAQERADVVLMDLAKR
jgi:hypothetical protein